MKPQERIGLLNETAKLWSNSIKLLQHDKFRFLGIACWHIYMNVLDNGKSLYHRRTMYNLIVSLITMVVHLRCHTRFKCFNILLKRCKHLLNIPQNVKVVDGVPLFPTTWVASYITWSSSILLISYQNLQSKENKRKCNCQTLKNT